MKKLCIGLLLIGTAQPVQAEWGFPPIGYRPAIVVRPDGTACPARYGLCAAWKRKRGYPPSARELACDRPTMLERIKARCGLTCCDK